MPPPPPAQNTKPPGYQTPLPQRRANHLEAVEDPEPNQEEELPSHDQNDATPYIPPDNE